MAIPTGFYNSLFCNVLKSPQLQAIHAHFDGFTMSGSMNHFTLSLVTALFTKRLINRAER